MGRDAMAWSSRFNPEMRKSHTDRQAGRQTDRQTGSLTQKLTNTKSTVRQLDLKLMTSAAIGAACGEGDAILRTNQVTLARNSACRQDIVTRDHDTAHPGRAQKIDGRSTLHFGAILHDSKSEKDKAGLCCALRHVRRLPYVRTGRVERAMVGLKGGVSLRG